MYFGSIFCCVYMYPSVLGFLVYCCVFCVWFSLDSLLVYLSVFLSNLYFCSWRERNIHTDRNLQCPERRQTSGLVRTQPPEGGEENSGLLYHRHGPGTGPWLLCGLGRNLLTCLAPQPTHLYMHANTIQFLIADITGSVTVITGLDVIMSDDFLTFSQVRHREWNTDDSHQVFNRNKRPQNRSDTDSFTFTSMDQLIEKR